MTRKKRAHPRKLEHLTSMLHDGCRTVSLEASPCSPKPQEETQRKTQRVVKLSEEYAKKQEEHQEKVGKTNDQPKCRRSRGGSPVVARDPWIVKSG
jgi:hypothetical protein